MSSMIVAPQPIAVKEGAKVLQAGGNAVDAAVTCALVHAIAIDEETGRLSGAADTGAGGMALGIGD